MSPSLPVNDTSTTICARLGDIIAFDALMMIESLEIVCLVDPGRVEHVWDPDVLLG